MSDDAIAALEELREIFNDASSKSFDSMCNAEEDYQEAYHNGQKNAFSSAEAFVHDALEELDNTTENEVNTDR